jgi:hypothetical protein
MPPERQKATCGMDAARPLLHNKQRASMRESGTELSVHASAQIRTFDP